MPHVSTIAVVITAFNAAPFVRRAVSTVRNQTVKADEIVLVDDGSVDGTVEIARSLGLAVIEQLHGGVGAARNGGIDAVRSEWIACLDVDDVWHPRKLEIFLETLAAEPTLGLVFSDFDSVAQKNGILHKGNVIGSESVYQALQTRRLTPLSSLLDRSKLSESLPSHSIILPSAAIFRRDLSQLIGGFSTNIAAEDTDFFLRLAAITETALLELPLVAYMQHSVQTTANWNLDAVRLELYEHVTRNQKAYHERTIMAYRKFYPTLLYYMAANQARNHRFAHATFLALKSLLFAFVRRSLWGLFQAISHSSMLEKICRNFHILINRKKMNADKPQTLPSTIRGVHIPWRIVQQ